MQVVVVDIIIFFFPPASARTTWASFPCLVHLIIKADVQNFGMYLPRILQIAVNVSDIIWPDINLS